MKYLLCTLIFLMAGKVNAQTKFTISGYIRDSANGESVIGATIAEPGSGRSVSSNQYGFYSLTLDSGSYQLPYRM